ncbi:MAG: hypothetical protein EKK41_01360 [Hyphomicrobiales bacterium]|nr:MAG: hypothetical protein EKK41_01360 [Hyphomicrobiales bacterium]
MRDEIAAVDPHSHDLGFSPSSQVVVMPPLEPAEWDEILRRIASGASVVETAKAFGVHPTSVHRRLKANSNARASKRTARKSSRRGTSRTARLKPDLEPSPAAAPAPRKSATPRGSALQVRRQLIGRLYRAIDTKLKLMERRMNSEVTALDTGSREEGANLTAADHERETRAFGALVKTINSVRQMQAELEDLANANPNATAADARLAADADRYRRDIAERLAKFVPPGA